MPVVQRAGGSWVLDVAPGEAAQWNAHYAEALPRYLNALDLAFAGARQCCEFQFLCSLLRVRGLQDAGWDPFETTLRAIPALASLHRTIEDFETARHFHLWLYVHILEASEPYEMLANLVDVAAGGQFLVVRFPPGRSGRPRSPEYKIRRLAALAAGATLAAVASPLQEIWDVDFRNAIAHADYTLHGDEVRTTSPARAYSHETVMQLVNRALAYHQALVFLFRHHLGRYTAPVTIPVDPRFSPDPDERAVVIVREGYGATGLKDAWTPVQRAAGKIGWSLARLYQDEWARLHADPTLALFPARPTSAK